MGFTMTGIAQGEGKREGGNRNCESRPLKVTDGGPQPSWKPLTAPAHSC